MKEWKTQETRDIGTKETGKKGGGSFGGRGDGYEDMVALGDDDIDQRRPQELQYYREIEESKPLFPPSRLCVHPCVCASVTLQHFIPLIAPEAPTALVTGAPEPRIYPRSG